MALFFSIIINLLLRPRLPPRKSGPIIEWAAFLEPAYVLFSIGVFLMFWALYFGFFYVRLSGPLPPPINTELIMITDQHLLPPSHRLHRPRISKSPPYPQRSRCPPPPTPRLRVRPLVRPHQPLRPTLHHPGSHDLLLDGSHHPRWYLCLRGRLWALDRRRPGNLRRRPSFAYEGSEQDWDTLWDGVLDPGVRDPDGPTDCGGAD